MMLTSCCSPASNYSDVAGILCSEPLAISHRIQPDQGFLDELKLSRLTRWPAPADLFAVAADALHDLLPGNQDVFDGLRTGPGHVDVLGTGGHIFSTVINSP